MRKELAAVTILGVLVRLDGLKPIKMQRVILRITMFAPLIDALQEGEQLERLSETAQWHDIVPDVIAHSILTGVCEKSMQRNRASQMGNLFRITAACQDKLPEQAAELFEDIQKQEVVGDLNAGAMLLASACERCQQPTSPRRLSEDSLRHQSTQQVGAMEQRGAVTEIGIDHDTGSILSPDNGSGQMLGEIILGARETLLSRLDNWHPLQSHEVPSSFQQIFQQDQNQSDRHHKFCGILKKLYVERRRGNVMKAGERQPITVHELDVDVREQKQKLNGAKQVDAQVLATDDEPQPITGADAIHRLEFARAWAQGRPATVAENQLDADSLRKCDGCGLESSTGHSGSGEGDGTWRCSSCWRKAWVRGNGGDGHELPPDACEGDIMEIDDRMAWLVALMKEKHASATCANTEEFTYLERRICMLAENLKEWRRLGVRVGHPQWRDEIGNENPEPPGPGGVMESHVFRLAPPASSNTLLVVFSSWFNVPDRAQPFEMVEFLSRHPLDVHTLILRDPNFSWYLDGVSGLAVSPEGVAEFIKREQRKLGATRLLTMGLCMGGYAALLIGSLVQADVTLVFNPHVFVDQSSLRWINSRQEVPADAPNEAQLEWDFVEMEAKARSRGLAKYLKLSNILPLKIGKVHVLLGDASASDWIQCTGLLEQPRLHVEIWPGTGHFLPRFLRERGKLGPVLRRVFFGEALAERTGQPTGGAHRIPDNQAESLRKQGDERLDAGERTEALQLYSAALLAGGGPSHHLVLASRAKVLLQLGNVEAAWADSHAASCLHPRCTGHLHTRALCEVALGDYVGALKTIQMARGLDPEDETLTALEVMLEKTAREKPSLPTGLLKDKM